MTDSTKRRPHGRRVLCSGGHRAYVPAPLPPRIEWSAGLASRLSEADRAIGRLAGEGRRLPNPHYPYWTVSKLAERLGVAFTTAQRAIDRLEAARIVVLASEAKRNRVYCARSILEILEEPPRIASAQRARRPGKRA